ncbi:MAG: O-antigen ligase family protein [Prevotella sp.]|nr:O-antigen ligase family protein [Prevotella sp.]
MRISVNLFVRIVFICTLLALVLAACFDMSMMEGGDVNGGTGRYVTALAYMAWLATISQILIPGYTTYKPAIPILLYALFFLWATFPTMMSGQKGMAYNLIFITFPLLVLLSTYNTVRFTGSHKWYIATFCCMLGILTIQYARVFSFINLLSDNSHLASSYYTLYMLPLVFLCKSNKVKVFAVLVVTIAILISLKRSGVMALVLAVVTYVFVNQYVAMRLKPTTILGSLTALVLFSFVFILVANSGEENIFERFENIGNDNGSGRLAVWEVTIKMISRLDVSSLLVGQGYNTVVANSPFNLSAHNDFLEIIYDYGLVGFSLYTCAILSLIYYNIKMIAEKSLYAPALSFLMVVYLIQSMISHIIIYFWACLFMLSFSYILASYHRDASN